MIISNIQIKTNLHYKLKEVISTGRENKNRKRNKDSSQKVSKQVLNRLFKIK